MYSLFSVSCFLTFFISGLTSFVFEILKLSTFGSSFRVGLNASDKSALRIDSSGNLTIGTSATQQVEIASNGSATFSGNLSAAGGTFSGTLSAVGGTFTGALNGGTISIGTAPNIFKADSNGIYLGDGTFANAEFRVTPAGALTTENITATTEAKLEF